MIKSHYLQSAFKRCCLTLLFLFSLTSFNASSYDFTVDGLYYTMLSMDDLTCKVSGWDETEDGKVTIPAIVTYKGRDISVIEIGQSAFKDHYLTSITLPSSLLKIGYYAFMNCYNLEEINLNSVNWIGDRAFQNCRGLKKITITSKLVIDQQAFEYCNQLRDIVGSELIVGIGYEAFKDCTSLQNVHFRDLRWIDDYAFSGCTSLTEVNIPSTVTEIRKGAFYSAYKDMNLKSFIIEDSDQSIYLEAKDPSWEYIAMVEYIYIGRDTQLYKDGSLTYYPLRIGRKLELGKYVNTFNCIQIWSHIDSLISHNLTPPSIPKASNSGYLNIEVRVPAEALEAYKQAPVWKNFWNIKAIEDESGVSDIECDDNDYFQVYDTNGILVDASCTSEKLQQLPHGVYIVVKQDKRMKIKI